ncbi:hypothetical protein Rcas_0400 [Roseiflexus castenholzii DSM 13941]|uniref:Uncharacterized protein n=1 Tax=Roseiflexus castenholzii (strain DSM 13941 / HLO8) TaxID=383372 RepID=A7NGE5_ROSCS|nr:hypothetical protein Rcas_0400 [Roseiflexus castenholzii DSM 13941]
MSRVLSAGRLASGKFFLSVKQSCKESCFVRFGLGFASATALPHFRKLVSLGCCQRASLLYNVVKAVVVLSLVKVSGATRKRLTPFAGGHIRCAQCRQQLRRSRVRAAS